MTELRLRELAGSDLDALLEVYRSLYADAERLERARAAKPSVHLASGIARIRRQLEALDVLAAPTKSSHDAG